MQTTNNNIARSNLEKKNRLRERIKHYLHYWPWFVLCTIITLSIGYLYIRYTPLNYLTTATIWVKDENKSDLSQMAKFTENMNMGQFNSMKLDNEIAVLKSRTLTKRTVEELDLHIQYFIEGRVRNFELYENTPIKIEVLSPTEEWAQNQTTTLFVTPISQTKFKIKQEESTSQEHTFGEAFRYQGEEYILYRHKLEDKNLNKTLRIDIRTVNEMVDHYRTKLEIAPEGVNMQSSIINIQLVSYTPNKSRKIINELIHQFNQEAIEYNKLISENAAEFIDERLHIIWGELDSVEIGKVSYKEKHQLVDLQKEGELFLGDASQFNQRLMEVQTELSQVNAIIQHLESGDKSNLLPANLGIADNNLVSLIQNYNQLILERNYLLVSTTESHPTILTLNKQLANMRSNILQSLRNLNESLNIKLQDSQRQRSYIGSQLAGIPTKERDFTNIERQQEIKQSLYIYLLQKREETSIALAVTEPKAKIVDIAYTPVQPVEPKKTTVLSMAILLGGLIPFGSLYFFQLLDNKVRRRSHVLASIPKANILVETPNMKRNYSYVKKNDLDKVAESFRILRTNMQYAGLLKKKEKGKVFMVTSSIKGEGKTTISVNLALTLSYAGNKILLVGADIRDPKLYRFFNKKTKPDGLVNYLMDEKSKISDFIKPSKISESMDIIHSGPIPPNPEEFLMMDRVNDFMEEAKNTYDYVILDTAPTLLVADTLMLSQKVDATLYVIRAGFIKNEVLDFAKDLQERGKLKNVNYIINGVREVNYGYGRKYGYGSQFSESIWEKTKTKFGASR